MKNKTTEEILLDFLDRYQGSHFHLDVEKREVDKTKNTFLLWFKVSAVIIYKDGADHTLVYGESYTLDKAIGQMIENSSKLRKPQIWPRRQAVEEHGFDGMENIVTYKEKPN